VRLVVRRVDRLEKVDRVVHERELAYVMTAAGREHANGPWENSPIHWPSRAIFVALPDGGLYLTRERAIRQLKAALPPDFVTVHTGVVANLDRVRLVSKDRPLLLGFPTLGSSEPREALWAEVAGARTRAVLDQLVSVRRAVRQAGSVAGNPDEVDESGDARLGERDPGAETLGRRDHGDLEE